MKKTAQAALYKFAEEMGQDNTIDEFLAAINTAESNRSDDEPQNITDPENQNTFANPTTHQHDIGNNYSVEQPYYNTPPMPPTDAY